MLAQLDGRLGFFAFVAQAIDFGITGGDRGVRCFGVGLGALQRHRESLSGLLKSLLCPQVGLRTLRLRLRLASPLVGG
ncbi:MAG TPA: hypothetical protein EYP98_05835 [Planctomycetes bacterium]|nr:hypothetical protein [Planctomycetota bacterium]